MLLGSPGIQNLPKGKTKQNALPVSEWETSTPVSVWGGRAANFSMPERNGTGYPSTSESAISPQLRATPARPLSRPYRNPQCKDLDLEWGPCQSWVDGHAAKPHRAWSSRGFVPSSPANQWQRSARSLVNVPADQGQEGWQTLWSVGLSPDSSCPGPSPRKQPGTAGSQDLLLTLDLVVRSAIHPVPVPLAPCFGQADPVGKSACCPVEELLQKDSRRRWGIGACVSLGIFTHPQPQPLNPQTQGWDSILTLTLTHSAGPLKMKGACLIFCLTR